MRFQAKHQIQGTPLEVEQCLLDERYLDYLLKHHGILLEVQLIEKKDEGDVLRRKVRYRPKPVIPSVGPKSVPPEWFAFVESSAYDKRKRELVFNNVPTTAKISRLLVNQGVLQIREGPGGQAERWLEGEIRLNLPFLLKPLAIIGERLIHAEGLKILDGEVPVLNRFIAEVLRK
jgi:hypothetical protein